MLAIGNRTLLRVERKKKRIFTVRMESVGAVQKHNDQNTLKSQVDDTDAQPGFWLRPHVDAQSPHEHADEPHDAQELFRWSRRARGRLQ